MNFQCPHCAHAYELSAAYLAEFAGCETSCAECGKTFSLPPVHAIAAPPDPDAAVHAHALAYAAPSLATRADADVWQDRGHVVFIRGKSLPRRCPKCGGAAIGKPTWLRFRFRPRGFVGVGIMAGAIEAASAEETTLRVFFCPVHHRQYHVLAWLFPLCGVSAMAGAIALSRYYPTHFTMIAAPIAGITMLLIGTLMGSAARRNMKIAAADKRFAWLSGCGEEFIKSLPDLESAQNAQAAFVAERLEGINQQ